MNGPKIWKVVNKVSGTVFEGQELTEDLLYYVQKNADEFHFYYANEETSYVEPDIVAEEEETTVDTMDPKKAELLLKSKEELLEIAKSLGVKVHHASGSEKIIDAILYGKE